jgi:5-methylcytosine-specific restriction enzyme A
VTRRHLSTRERLRLFTLHGGICHFCERAIDGTRDRWEVSHVIPYELTRDESDANMQPAHYACHREHTAKVDQPRIAKAKRVAAKHIGAHKSRSTLAGSKASRWKRKLDGTVVPRE